MTLRPVALLDSNVIIAAIVDEHQPHQPSSTLLAGMSDGRLAIAAHSFAEAYATLTSRRTVVGFGLPPENAWRSLMSVAEITTLIGLQPSDAFEDVGLYAQAAGIGPRLYDHLIGRVAVRHGIPRIVTWNLRHMRDLFPALDVVDPTATPAA